ncbi:MAG: exosortase [Bacteroidetes bacterium]|nr:exosortase [Bacteroidota bacterium]
MKKFIPYIIVLILLFSISYYDTIDWMISRYLSSDSYYSHGFLIPFVSGYLIWLKQEELKAVQISTSWFGLGLVILAAVVHLFGTAVYIFSVSGFSVWVLLIGSYLFLFGWGRTKIISIPLLYILFMFPLPLAFITMISFPLKMLVANYSVKLVQLTGIPIFQEGFNIIIPQGTLLVGNPCSGLRSLIAFLALGSLFAYMSSLSIARKWMLFFLSVPAALLSNLIRVPILILWSYKFGLAAAAPDTLVHTGSGIFVFVFGIMLLFFATVCLGGTRGDA